MYKESNWEVIFQGIERVKEYWSFEPAIVKQWIFTHMSWLANNSQETGQSQSLFFFCVLGNIKHGPEAFG